MRQFFRMLLLALVLLTVALISALTAMRFAIHGREVSIPKLVGMTPTEAEHAVADSGLQLVVERQYYSSDVAEGRVISQVPEPGTRVRRGWSIRVAQSLGPQRVVIPDVAGQSERVAELNIQRRGLSIGSIAQVPSPDAPTGQVLAQNPPANASGVLVPQINLLLSSGSKPSAFVMPNFTGQPLGSATVILQDAGIRLGKVIMVPEPAIAGTATSVPETPVPAASAAQPGPTNMIVNQSPAPGNPVMAGSAVTFEVH